MIQRCCFLPQLIQKNAVNPLFHFQELRLWTATSL